MRLVERRRLFDALDEAVGRGVAAVVAPAGAGKSVLVRSWLEGIGDGRPVAWVSVRRGERDAQRLWMDVAAELHRAGGPVEPLSPTPNFDGERVVETLLEQLASADQAHLLVIDDVHELVSGEARSQLELLLSARPATLQVVLLTRRDVQLGLHRLRIAGQLGELRADELRFSLAETGGLLRAAGLDLSEEEIALLHRRTEGWGTGLRLAAMLLGSERDAKGVIAQFSGNERTVADYLLAEVLDHQPEPVKRVLLDTSILETVDTRLANHLSGGDDSEIVLRDLEDAGAFVSSVDRDRTVFRYHQLFADMLRLELRRQRPQDVERLHATAARWLLQEGRVAEAIRHASAASDWGLATSLLVDNLYSLLLAGEEDTINSMMEGFPAERVAADPELALVIAATELARGSLATGAAHIAIAERHAQQVPEGRRRQFEVGVAVARLSLARRRGDFDSVISEVEPLLRPSPAETHQEIAVSNDLRALALMNLGIAETWSLGHEDAERHLQEAAALARRIGRPYVEVTSLVHAATAVGRRSFNDAERACRDAVEAAEAQGWGDTAIVAPALVALGSALMQTGRLDEAEGCLERAEQALRSEVEPAVALMLFAARGAVEQARGRAEQALVWFEAVDRMQTLLATRHPLALQIRSARLQIRVSLGELDEVRDELAAMDDEELRWGTTREAIAALALADGDPQAAIEVLAPVLDGSAPLHHVGVVVRALLLDARAQSELGEAAATAASLERALELAEPDTLIQPFLLQPAARALLEEHPRHATAHGAFLATLLDVLRGSETVPGHGATLTLEEPLSDAELRVLRFLPSNLRVSEIASELYLSVHTVRTHMRHIYAKLDTHTRSDTVQRAREAGLLAPSSRRRLG